MAIDQINISTPSSLISFTDSAMGNAVDGVKASSAKLYSVVVDNSANGGAASYVKIFNATSGSVTVGVTSPDIVIFVPGGAILTVPFFTGASQGVTLGTALSAACVTAGGTAGTVSPASPVVVTINYV